MKFIVKTPSEVFNGKRAGVQFNKGEAVTEDAEKAAVLKDLGYSVVEVKAAAEKPKAKRAVKKSGE